MIGTHISSLCGTGLRLYREIILLPRFYGLNPPSRIPTAASRTLCEQYKTRSDISSVKNKKPLIQNAEQGGNVDRGGYA